MTEITADNSTRSRLRVILAASIGSALEWYDFFLYGTAAALVFGELFFPKTDPVVGTLLAFLTFGVGFVVRPLGGILFGIMGDRFGRKPVLVATLLMTFKVNPFLVPVHGTRLEISINSLQQSVTFMNAIDNPVLIQKHAKNVGILCFCLKKVMFLRLNEDFM